MTTVTTRPAGIRPWWIIGAAGFVILASIAGLLIGPISLNRGQIILDVLDAILPGSIDTTLTEQQSVIIRNIRLPRVVLALLVGASLGTSGASYQGVFRNPLADPFLLGVAAGGGLGATIAFVFQLGDGRGVLDPVQILAFAGAMLAVGLTWVMGVLGDRTNSATTLILAGVAVASFLTAIQTFLQQQNSNEIRRVFAWVLGGLNTSGWSEVLQLLPVAVICIIVLWLSSRTLDVLSVGDEEATALGMSVGRARAIIVTVASLLTAAAVAVSGLIAFVGLIVPHTIRLIFGSSFKVIVPLSTAAGAGFLVLCDLLARTLLTPAELPIGVVTAFFGAPFFVVILRTARLR